MINKPQTATKRITRWLIPQKEHLYCGARLIYGLIGNVVIASYHLPRREHLFDARDYRYVDLDMQWIFLAALIPPVVLLGLLPVLRSQCSWHRWVAIGLMMLPVALTITQWFQGP